MKKNQKLKSKSKEFQMK